MIDMILSAANEWGWSFVFWSAIGLLAMPLHILIPLIAYWRKK